MFIPTPRWPCDGIEQWSSSPQRSSILTLKGEYDGGTDEEERERERERERGYHGAGIVMSMEEEVKKAKAVWLVMMVVCGEEGK